jgi:hypothetical protein
MAGQKIESALANESGCSAEKLTGVSTKRFTENSLKA